MRLLLAALSLVLAATCNKAEPVKEANHQARNLLLVTIDTLRADRVGAYGDPTARTSAIDALAARGAIFVHAYATSPITLPSHASMMTGRYPAGHAARHNGIRMDLAVPTLAERLARNGFTTGAFVAAFPLDRRFGLIKGFQTYGDSMPRGPEGRPANERAGAAVVDEALAWLNRSSEGRFFLWVHLFEPHAPYGDARDGRSAEARYGDEIAEADRQVARLVAALGDKAASTLTIVASDHGEAFGEHGEISHSVFIYDTTLRVPLIVAGPGVRPGTRITQAVALVDIASTASSALGAGTFDSDGIDLSQALAGAEPRPRALFAESFAPLLDFGWSPLKSIREGEWKYIDAPKPELFHIASDGAENVNRFEAERARASSLEAQTRRYSGGDASIFARKDPETAARLQALGYVGRGVPELRGARPDPKDQKALAARIAQVLSGELHGDELERALRGVLADDPENPLANLRLGYVLLEANRCRDAVPRFRAAIAAQLPSADAHLGLAACQTAQRDFAGAADTLRAAVRAEPGNPIVLANLGLVLSDGGHPLSAVDPLQRALTADPNLHQARFALAIAFARANRPADAAKTAEELLRRLPADAPQRPEVQRLIESVR
jgi:arylsulfatase A-like enzyme/cytochrome c-type biogenesis protein CcmH/NrfG